MGYIMQYLERVRTVDQRSAQELMNLNMSSLIKEMKPPQKQKQYKKEKRRHQNGR